MPFLPVQLRDGFVPVVQPQDTIRVGQILATRSAPIEHSLQIAKSLDVPIKKAHSYLRKNPGDTIEPGEEIAVKKNIWGKKDASVISSKRGIVSRYDRESATMYIRLSDESTDEQTIISPIEGTIALCNNEKILIETEKHALVGKQGSGGSKSGTLLYIQRSENDAIQSYEVDASSIGNIITGKYFPREILIKAISMDVGAIIGTKFLDEDVSYLKERKITMPIVEIEEADLAKLTHWHGKKVFVHGEGKTIILLHN